MSKHPLRLIAKARSGDKGSNANIGVIANSPEAYYFLRKELTEEIVNEYFKPLGVFKTSRYELPNLKSFNFVLEGVLGLGGSRSLRTDAQGKALGQALLEILLPIPEVMINTHQHQTPDYAPNP